MSIEASALTNPPTEHLHVLPTENSRLDHVRLEDLHVTNFLNKESFFSRFAALVLESKKNDSKKSPEQGPAVSLTYNVFSANLAHQNPAFKSILQRADILRCDGVGALMASRMVKDPIHTRLTNADYFPEMLEYLASRNLTVFLIGGKPGVAEAALKKLETMVRFHSVVGVHHGYIHQDEALNQEAIDQINALKPDVLVVGMGMPVQEFWIERHRHQLNTHICFAVGAMIDYFGDAQFRCPKIFQLLGLEWLTRLLRYPKRMFSRYVIGNPAYLYRISRQALGLDRSKVAETLLSQ